MSDPWRKVCSLKDEINLSEIMSEELCDRLQIDDFVWVDGPTVPEDQSIKENCTESVSTDSEILNRIQMYNATNCQVAQYNSNNESVYLKDTDFESDDAPELDDLEEFKIVKKKPSDILKAKYPTPQWLKRLEHGTVKNNSVKKNVFTKNKNNLLPKINFYPSTIAVLERFIKDRYLSQYYEVIGTGKNSVVVQAECGRVRMSMPRHNAVKVYKISNDQEKNKTVFKRVKREFDHLTIVHAYNGFRNSQSPEPIRAAENVIIMSFVGFQGNASTSIHDVPKDKHSGMYHQIVNFMHKCYNVMHLVHGKLSTKKILCWGEEPWFIGWSHSVKTDHPQAMTKLMRDCLFVTAFYKDKGVAVQTTEELFKEITGCNKISSKLMEIIVKKNLYEMYDCNPNHRRGQFYEKNRFK